MATVERKTEMEPENTRIKQLFADLKILSTEVTVFPTLLEEKNTHEKADLCLGGQIPFFEAMDTSAVAPGFAFHTQTRTINVHRRYISSILLATVYLIGLTIAETITTKFDATFGVVMHGIILLLLFINSAANRNLVRQRLLVAFSFVPLIRILSLTLPLQDFNFTVWYPLVGIPLFLAVFIFFHYSRYRVSDIGLHCSNLPVQILVGLTGIGIGFVEYQILRPEPLVNQFLIEKVWFPAMILFFFTGLLEEVVFRGVMQKAFVDGLGRLCGILYVAILFSVLHLGYQSVLNVLFVFTVGMFFGWIVQNTRTIVGVTIAHGLTNIFLFLVFPFAIS